MAKKRLLEHFQSKDPKQFIDYKTLLDIFYRCPMIVIWNILINYLDDHDRIFIKVEVKDKDIDRKCFWNNLSNFIIEKLRFHFNQSNDEWIASNYNEIKNMIQNLISEKFRSMLKEMEGQYQLEEIRLPIIGMFERPSQIMIYLMAYESDQIAIYSHLQTAFANLQEIRVEIPISTVILNIAIESIAITTILPITNP